MIYFISNINRVNRINSADSDKLINLCMKANERTINKVRFIVTIALTISILKK